MTERFVDVLTVSLSALFITCTHIHTHAHIILTNECVYVHLQWLLSVPLCPLYCWTSTLTGSWRRYRRYVFVFCNYGI